MRSTRARHRPRRRTRAAVLAKRERPIRGGRREGSPGPTTGAPSKKLAIPLLDKRPLGDYYTSQIAVAFGSDWVTTWPGQNGLTDPAVGSLLRLTPS